MRRAANQEATLPAAIVELDTPALRDAFARDVADLNRRRLRVIGPIMVVVHIVHAGLFRRWAADPDTFDAATIVALNRFVIVHWAMVAVTGALTVMVFRSASQRVARAMGPVVATLYLTHGGLATAIGLESTRSVSTYIGYCLGMGVILCLSTRTAVVAYCLGLLTLVASLLVVVPKGIAFLATMPTCGTITAVGAALAAVNYAARRREFRQRLTIERQRDQLGALNSDLERRVQAQVGEIVAHATEVEQLNAQLRAQVDRKSVV